MSEKILAVKVHGMSCQGCVNAVKSIRGVKDTDVSLEKKRAIIRFDSEHTDESNLRKAIKEAGYATG